MPEGEWIVFTVFALKTDRIEDESVAVSMRDRGFLSIILLRRGAEPPGWMLAQHKAGWP